MKDWFKINRSILDHWVYKDAEDLKAWMTILAKVNFAESKVKIGATLLTCKRGEALFSLDSWAGFFGSNWDKNKVRRFFKLLEKDKMIYTKNERITTRLTVCKYEDYQGTENANETGLKRNRNADESQMTPREEGEEGKEERRSIYPSYEEFKSHAIEKAVKLEIEIDEFKLKAKFLSWSENDWNTLVDPPRKIANWKSTLTNSLKYMIKEKEVKKPFGGRFAL